MKKYFFLLFAVCFGFSALADGEKSDKKERENIFANVSYVIDYSNQKDPEKLLKHMAAIERDLKNLILKNEGEVSAKTALEATLKHLNKVAAPIRDYVNEGKKGKKSALTKAFLKIHEKSQKMFPWARGLKDGKLENKDAENIDAALKALDLKNSPKQAQNSSVDDDASRKENYSPDSSANKKEKFKSQKVH